MKNRVDMISDYFLQHQSIFDFIKINEIEMMVDSIDIARKNNKTVFIAGNGGSATTASHFATDIGIGSLTRANPVRAISLCDNSAVVTAIANDIDYSSIFEQQLQLLGAKDDLLLVISASGNSINLIKAVEMANAMGIISYSLTGFDGGKLKEITKGKNIHIETPKGTYGLVEDAHLAICHVITECIRSIK
jgi:D-sedoheptulose 7-phosphate isomerase